uniref:Sushi domain-containing protein n=2 Tax=Steinernema glaseri TaxID=37863 RepID=A0A1I7YM39_9BILA
MAVFCVRKKGTQDLGILMDKGTIEGIHVDPVLKNHTTVLESSSCTSILSFFIFLCLMQWVHSCAPISNLDAIDQEKASKKCSQDSLSLDGVTPSFSKDTTTATLKCKAKTKEVAFFLFNDDADRKFEKPSSTETVLKCVDGKWKSSELDAPITKVACGTDAASSVDCKSCSLKDLKKIVTGALQEQSGKCLTATLTCTSKEILLVNGIKQAKAAVSFTCEGKVWTVENGATRVPLVSARCAPKVNNDPNDCSAEDLNLGENSPTTIQQNSSNWELACPPQKDKFVYLKINNTLHTEPSPIQKTLDLRCQNFKWTTVVEGAAMNVTTADCVYEDSCTFCANLALSDTELSPLPQFLPCKSQWVQCGNGKVLQFDEIVTSDMSSSFVCNNDVQWTFSNTMKLQTPRVTCVDRPTECSTENIRFVGDHTEKPKIERRQGTPYITCDESTAGPYIKINGDKRRVITSTFPMLCEDGYYKEQGATSPILQLECVAKPLCASCAPFTLNTTEVQRAGIEEADQCLMDLLVCRDDTEVLSLNGQRTDKRQATLHCSADGTHVLEDGTAVDVDSIKCVKRPCWDCPVAGLNDEALLMLNGALAGAAPPCLIVPTWDACKMHSTTPSLQLENGSLPVKYDALLSCSKEGTWQYLFNEQSQTLTVPPKCGKPTDQECNDCRAAFNSIPGHDNAVYTDQLHCRIQQVRCDSGELMINGKQSDTELNCYGDKLFHFDTSDTHEPVERIDCQNAREIPHLSR